MQRLSLTLVALLSLLGPILRPASVRAQDETPPPSLSASAPLEEILAHEGETITITGFVETTSVNVTGIQFLDFKDSDFVCVTFARSVPAFAESPPSERYKAQWVSITGTLEKYRGAPQMKLESPDQAVILEEPPAGAISATPEPAPAEPDPEMLAEPETPALQDPKPPAPPAPTGVEVVNGEPAVDWRQFFPPASP